VYGNSEVSYGYLIEYWDILLTNIEWMG